MKPLAFIASIWLTAFLPPHAVAEVEYEIHTGFTTEFSSCFGTAPRKTFPILIKLTDANGKPIPNAIVVLKRMGPDGWPEEELKKERTSITDQKGLITLIYPMPMTTGSKDDKGKPTIPIYGAVTVIAKGYPSTTMELRNHFKDGHYTQDPDQTTHIRLTLARPQN